MKLRKKQTYCGLVGRETEREKKTGREIEKMRNRKKERERLRQSEKD